MKKTVIGIILIVVSFAGIIGWELIGREEIMYTDMLVLNKDVEAYQLITEDMLASRKVFNPMPGALTVDDMGSVVGKESVQFVAKGSEIYLRYFEDPALTINPESDFVFSVNSNDITAYPRSIKRGDNVYFYSYNKKIASAAVLALKDGNGDDVNKKKTGEEDQAKQISSIEFKMDLKNLQILSNIVSERKPLTIAYN